MSFIFHNTLQGLISLFLNLLYSPTKNVSLGVIIFGSIRLLSKKDNQTELKKNRFGFLEQKPVQTGLAHFFLLGSVFFLFGSVFSISVRFFQFPAYKTEPVSFFKILIIDFFSQFGFFAYPCLSRERTAHTRSSTSSTTLLR